MRLLLPGPFRRYQVGRGLGGLLTPLSELGVAEVSFGGGEPLAFRGFHDLVDRLYDETPADVVAVWRREIASFARPAPREGCARLASTSLVTERTDGVFLHRAFFSNNSGACILVGKFRRIEVASALASLLAPEFKSGEPYGDAWRAIFDAEGIRPGVGEHAPEHVVALGSAISFHTDMTLDDDFPSLRELVFRKGGLSLHDAIHDHGNVTLLVGLRAHDSVLEGLRHTRGDSSPSVARMFEVARSTESRRMAPGRYGWVTITGMAWSRVSSWHASLHARAP